jgi:hypothetical protein
MSYTIRWNAPLSTTQRRWLRCWLDRVAHSRPGLVERHRGALTVRHTTEEFAHSFAALTMAVLDRPTFAYSLEAAPEPTGALAAA